ncbi:MAG: DUF2079 domain-containing protein [Chloroflexi bacterium]|nr:DUF2079 domain-containing protein [Chloroflexota bacterium]
MNPEIARIIESLIILLASLCVGAIASALIARTRVSLSPRWIRTINWLAAGSIVIFGWLFCAQGLRRFETLNLFGDDFAFFNQAIWNSLRGRLLENTAYLDSATILGHHFSPLLLALVPLYLFDHAPRILAILPALAVAGAAFPLYWFARHQLGAPRAFVILIAFFLAPITQALGTGQFYEIVLAVPLLMFALFFLMRQRYAPFLVCLALAMLVKEEVPILAIGIGIYIALIQRKRAPGFTLAASGLIILLALLLWVIPFFQGGTNYYFFGGSAERPGMNVYGYLGNNLGQILTTVLTRPDLVLQHVLIEPKIQALLFLIVPLGALPLLGIEMTAIAFPTLAYILLADSPPVYAPNAFHYAPVVPFLFFGLVIGLRRIMFSRAAPSVFILAASIIAAFVFNQGEPFALIDPQRFPITVHSARAEPIARMIPPRAVVLAQSELMSLVSTRQFAYGMPSIPCVGLADYLFADTQRPWFAYRQTQWEESLRSPIFETVIEQDGYILKQRIPPAQKIDLNFADRITLIGYTPNVNGTLIGGAAVQPVLTWRVQRAMREQLIRVARITDEQGHSWLVDERAPGECATDQLSAEIRVSDQLHFDLPPTMPSGNYRLSVGVQSKTTRDYLAMQGRAEEIFLTAFTVQKNTASFTASQLKIEMPLFVDLGEARFLGSTFLPEKIAPGDTIVIGLYWRARVKPRGDYFVAVQVRDSAGRIAAEHHARPANGAYPTTRWVAGEVLLDWHDVILPSALAPGAYTLHVALSDAASGAVLGETMFAKISITPR